MTTSGKRGSEAIDILPLYRVSHFLPLYRVFQLQLDLPQLSPLLFSSMSEASLLSSLSPEIEPAPLPADAVPLSISGRALFLPSVYSIPRHSKVPQGHGQIYLLVYDWRKPNMEELLKQAADLNVPKAGADVASEGEPPIGRKFAIQPDRR